MTESEINNNILIKVNIAVAETTGIEPGNLANIQLYEPGNFIL